MALRFVATSAVWAGIALAGVLAWYAHDLPDTSALGAATRRPVVSILAADGSVLVRRGDYYGEPVTPDTLPPHLIQAILATEDRRFFGHPGVDLIGVTRAAVTNMIAGRVVAGGSTITQQLAKNLFLGRERTMKRKVQELMLAFWLERKFTKQQILTVYLNRVYMGGGAYGVDAAARHYFGKPAAALNLFEAAVLAGLLKAPSRDNPLSDPQRAAARGRVVLANMVEAGYLGAEAAAAAGKAPLQVAPPGGTAQELGYFTDWVLAQLDDYVGVAAQDLVVETTLDPRVQSVAERSLEAGLETGAAKGVGQGAVVTLSPDGAVRGMVGGRDYRRSPFNRATQALRQPGSAFKMFVFLAGIEAGMRPGDSVVDQPVTVGGWSPRNYGGEYRGRITLREAAARSSNSVAVQIAERVGRGRVIDAARRLGVTAPLAPDPSLALGSNEVTLLEMAGAFAVLANDGVAVWPYAIERVRTGGGEVLYRRQGAGPGRVVARQDVALMNDLLGAAVSWGTARRARLDRPAAGKTGTTSDNRDAWFIGYTAELVTAVWVGNDDGKPMDGVAGGSIPAGIWHEAMRDALAGQPARPLLGLGGTDVSAAIP